MILNSKNYIKACRVCLVFPEKNDRINIYDHKVPEHGVSYFEAFEELRFEFGGEGDMPLDVCKNCAVQIEAALNLKRLVEQSSEIIHLLKNKKKDTSSFNEITIKFTANKQTDSAESIDDEIEVTIIPTKDADNTENTASGSTNEAEQSADTGDGIDFIINTIANNKNGIKSTKKGRFDIVKKTKQDPIIEYTNRKHVCNVCHKRFLKKSNLIDHLRIHASTKIYRCEVCEKGFCQSGNFKTHLRTHTGEKPFKCEVCSKSYTQSSALKIHMRTHTSEKNYKCQVCDKAFTNGSDLAKHKNIHEPDKKFKCDLCSKSFAQNIHLRKHKLNHHNEKS